ncbi:MAG: hypothetical protein A3G59_01660 [Candidatus Taylorbacteria bacterium RIFCSPLOWO2_12_FULL_47_20]|uniref:Uncharacterized protein n=1 Tax=Candidatus Taylorbacteria bacterium RIFCSPLOWO2_12_FULL_47_20 TaxID=1802335 RepID=A0A1G2PAH1_9BACT|nr:MAG: hypothetical protein A3G59_01660 [Candidatus Taylorbacteria bacterium RIFCSPLOWO2_12_FULL_47_20]
MRTALKIIYTLLGLIGVACIAIFLDSLKTGRTNAGAYTGPLGIGAIVILTAVILYQGEKNI